MPTMATYFLASVLDNGTHPFFLTLPFLPFLFCFRQLLFDICVRCHYDSNHTCSTDEHTDNPLSRLAYSTV
jgi:hypothetical protein